MSSTSVSILRKTSPDMNDNVRWAMPVRWRSEFDVSSDIKNITRPLANSTMNLLSRRKSMDPDQGQLLPKGKPPRRASLAVCRLSNLKSDIKRARSSLMNLFNRRASAATTNLEEEISSISSRNSFDSVDEPQFLIVDRSLLPKPAPRRLSVNIFSRN